jgi:hypothetical protein
MPTNINDILQSFNRDLARPNRFDVTIVPPAALRPNLNIGGDVPGNSYTDLLAYRCEIAQLPGRHLSTIEQKTYGPFEKFPHHTTYTDIDLTFIVDADMVEKYFFDAWLEYINPTNDFNIAYKGDYCTDITISQYDMANQLTYKATLVDAYPVGVNQMDLDWSNDGFHKLSVTFAYTYWYNGTQSSSRPLSANDGNSLSYLGGTFDSGSGTDW